MKNRILSIALAAVLYAGVFSAPAQEYISTSATAYAAAAVSAPTASKKSGTYTTSGTFSVKLTAASGAKIYYSTGSGYKLYTKALKISKNTTLKCYAEKNDTKSKTATYTYKLVPKVTISAAAGTYSEPVTVKLSSTASGVKFYYTLDGSKPTTSSAKYTTKGITISESSKLRIAAVKSGWTKKYYTREYVIEDNSSASVESLLDDYTRKYAYNTLNDAQKQIYAKIFDAVSAHESKVDFSGMNVKKSDMEKAYWAFDYENPQFIWLANGYSYLSGGSNVISMEIKLSRNKEDGQEQLELMEKAAEKIVAKAMKQDDLFDRVKTLHDAVTDNTKYTTRGPACISEADGPLLNGIGLCEGYSKAFMYLCQMAGIECICVSGYAGEAHMWNMLKLDGEWYNMDVTWNDNGVYDYFCLPTSKIKSTHSFKNAFTVPSATATKYTYSNVMGIDEYTTLIAAYDGLVSKAASNLKNGVAETTVNISGSFMSSLVKKINQSVWDDLSALGCSFTRWSITYTDKTLTLTLS